MSRLISVFRQIDLHYSDESNVPFNFLLSGIILHKLDNYPKNPIIHAMISLMMPDQDLHNFRRTVYPCSAKLTSIIMTYQMCLKISFRLQQFCTKITHMVSLQYVYNDILKMPDLVLHHFQRTVYPCSVKLTSIMVTYQKCLKFPFVCNNFTLIDTHMLSLRSGLASISKDCIFVLSQTDLHYSDVSNVPLNFLLSERFVHKGDTHGFSPVCIQ